MEPVSTLIAITSIAVGATARPRWEPPRIEVKLLPKTAFVDLQPAPTRFLIAPAARDSGNLPIVMTSPRAAASHPFITLKDRLIAEVQAFHPAHPGSDPGIVSDIDDIFTAAEFLTRLPAGIPLPTLMRTDDGQIGMYWDIDDIYMDINIDPGRRLSLFSKVRSEAREIFIDAIPLDAIDANWAFEHIGMLTNPRMLAA
jgi:hypothetical protein